MSTKAIGIIFCLIALAICFTGCASKVGWQGCIGVHPIVAVENTQKLSNVKTIKVRDNE